MENLEKLSRKQLLLEKYLNLRKAVDNKIASFDQQIGELDQRPQQRSEIKGLSGLALMNHLKELATTRIAIHAQIENVRMRKKEYSTVRIPRIESQIHKIQESLLASLVLYENELKEEQQSLDSLREALEELENLQRDGFLSQEEFSAAHQAYNEAEQKFKIHSQLVGSLRLLISSEKVAVPQTKPETTIEDIVEPALPVQEEQAFSEPALETLITEESTADQTEVEDGQISEVPKVVIVKVAPLDTHAQEDSRQSGGTQIVHSHTVRPSEKTSIIPTNLVIQKFVSPVGLTFGEFAVSIRKMAVLVASPEISSSDRIVQISNFRSNFSMFLNTMSLEEAIKHAHALITFMNNSEQGVVVQHATEESDIYDMTNPAMVITMIINTMKKKIDIPRFSNFFDRILDLDESQIGALLVSFSHLDEHLFQRPQLSNLFARMLVTMSMKRFAKEMAEKKEYDIPFDASVIDDETEGSESLFDRRDDDPFNNLTFNEEYDKVMAAIDHSGLSNSSQIRDDLRQQTMVILNKGKRRVGRSDGYGKSIRIPGIAITRVWGKNFTQVLTEFTNILRELNLLDNLGVINKSELARSSHLLLSGTEQFAELLSGQRPVLELKGHVQKLGEDVLTDTDTGLEEVGVDEVLAFIDKEIAEVPTEDKEEDVTGDRVKNPYEDGEDCEDSEVSDDDLGRDEDEQDV